MYGSRGAVGAGSKSDDTNSGTVSTSRGAVGAGSKSNDEDNRTVDVGGKPVNDNVALFNEEDD